jgi:hypothetical protein
MKTTLYVKELDDGNEEIVDIATVDYSDNPIVSINHISNRILQLYKDIEDQNVTPYIEE